MRERARREPWIWALFGCFVGGMLVGWTLRGGPPVPSSLRSTPSTAQRDDGGARKVGPSAGAEQAVDGPAGGRLSTGREIQPSAPRVQDHAGAAIAEPTIGSAAPMGDAIRELAGRRLRVPIDGADVSSWKRMFAEGRDAGGRQHEAVDILTPRGTPVHAVESGRVAKLFYSKAGGKTVYQFDPAQRFCYYYAHLDRYAADLKEGRAVARGDVLGYVGSSGNAPAGTPHLHFAIFELEPNHHWWKGKALDPYPVFQTSR